MQPYADKTYYTDVFGGTQIPPDEQEKLLLRASYDVDALTLGRTAADGFEALSERGKDLVRRAVCTQAEFHHAYGVYLDSPLTSYGINGVSIGFDAKAVTERGGAKAPSQVMALLRNAGLTYLGVR